MKERIRLVAIPSWKIVSYISDPQHVISWDDIDMARRNGEGDRAGLPPIHSMPLFFGEVVRRGSLFSQNEFIEMTIDAMGDWYKSLQPINQRGIRAKARCNFYVSGIDTLHAWSLLSETGAFDACYIDSIEDVDNESDVTVIAKNGRSIHIALIGPKGDIDLAYKRVHRRKENAYKTTVIQLPYSHPMRPGNKRWYDIGMFADVVRWSGNIDAVSRVNQDANKKSSSDNQASKIQLPPEDVVDQCVERLNELIAGGQIMALGRFTLRPGITVNDPEKYARRLLSVLADWPNGIYELDLAVYNARRVFEIIEEREGE